MTAILRGRLKIGSIMVGDEIFEGTHQLYRDMVPLLGENNIR
jgi:hypothetical protein